MMRRHGSDPTASITCGPIRVHARRPEHFEGTVTVEPWSEAGGVTLRPRLLVSASVSNADSFDAVEIPIRLDDFGWENTRFLVAGDSMGQEMRRYDADRFTGEEKSGTYLLFRNGSGETVLVGFLSWRMFCAELTFRGGTLAAKFYGDGKPLLSGRRIPLEALIVLRGGTAAELQRRYALAVARENQVKLNRRTWRGWGSWDYYAARFTESDLLENLEALKTLSPASNLFQIDDGYSVWGDWLRFDRQRLPNGLTPVFQAVRSAGLECGIWLAPFLAHTGSELVKEHPDWFLRAADGTLFHAGSAQLAVLDYSIDEVCDYISGVIAWFVGQGIRYFKLDFLWCGASPCRGRRAMTSLERFHRCLATIRHAAGREAYLLGCSAKFGPAIGHVDGMRSGPDISPNFTQLRLSLFANLENSCWHGACFCCDPDYLVLRGRSMNGGKKSASPGKFGTLSRSEAELWRTFVMLCGDSVISGDRLRTLSSSRRDAVRRTLARPADSEPCRMLDCWSGGASAYFCGIVGKGRSSYAFNWNDAPRQISLVPKQRCGAHSIVKLPDGAAPALEPESPIRAELPPTGEFLPQGRCVSLPLGAAGNNSLRYDRLGAVGVLEGAYEQALACDRFAGIPFEFDASGSVVTCDQSFLEPRTIQIGRKLNALYVLHAADFPVSGEWLDYILTDGQGNSVRHPLFLGREIGNTDFRYSQPWRSVEARIGWADPISKRCLYVLEIPVHGRLIQTLTVTIPRQAGTHILAAITGVEK